VAERAGTDPSCRAALRRRRANRPSQSRGLESNVDARERRTRAGAPSRSSRNGVRRACCCLVGTVWAAVVRARMNSDGAEVARSGRTRLVIEPGRSARNYWRDLWRYRELLYFLTWRDILVRYKQTVIGVAWA